MTQTWTTFEKFTLIYMVIFMCADIAFGLIIGVELSLLGMPIGFGGWILITLTWAFIADRKTITTSQHHKL